MGASSRTDMVKDVEDDADEARNRYIKPPHPSLSLAEIAANPRAEERPELHPQLQALTRLTGLTASVVCLFGSEAKPLLDPDGDIVSLTSRPIPRRLAPSWNALSYSRIPVSCMRC